jgi:hypothetical protein
LPGPVLPSLRGRLNMKPDPNHYPECPRSRDHHNECVCDLLRACRAAERKERDSSRGN